jgi:hypothetical protein
MLAHGTFECAPLISRNIRYNASERHLGAALWALRQSWQMGGGGHDRAPFDRREPHRTLSHRRLVYASAGDGTACALMERIANLSSDAAKGRVTAPEHRGAMPGPSGLTGWGILGPVDHEGNGAGLG